MAQRVPLHTAVNTSIALIDQFTASLMVSQSAPANLDLANIPSPLSLLTASATTLKSQTTKLSLLTITAPFTSTAVSSNLTVFNDSILPSLVTAIFLITPESFTTSFSSEAKVLTRATLQDLKCLVEIVQDLSQNHKHDTALSVRDKQSVTEATGKVWQDCDELIDFANMGFGGFVVRKATQWLDLMKDAVKELQEFDPEEDEEHDLFGDRYSDAGSEDPTNTSEDTYNSAMIKAGIKSEALKVLTRIPQSVHVVIKQRLEKIPLPPELSMKQKATIERLLVQHRQVSECIDECAESIYMGDLEGCLKKAGEARQITIRIVQAVILPWRNTPGQELNSDESKEDKYISRALDWITQVNAQPQNTKGVDSPHESKTPVAYSLSSGRT